jgi:hypothetical protein
MSWFAKRPVHLLTNCYPPPPTSVDEDEKVQRWLLESGVKVQWKIALPPAVKLYNQYMGAVDLFNQLCLYAGLDLPCRKFWHPMYWFVIEAALIHAWVLYKATMEAAKLPIGVQRLDLQKERGVDPGL